MSTAEQIIADHQYVPDGRMLGTRCTNVTCDWFVPASTSFADMLVSYGAHVVAALTNAGKVVVDLPEADSIDHLAQPRFGSVTAGDGVVSDDEGYEYDPVEARIRAAALLAAARVAEGGER